MFLEPVWDTPEKIASYRAAVLAQHAKGWLTDTERGVALGVLGEAEALLKLKQARQNKEGD